MYVVDQLCVTSAPDSKTHYIPTLKWIPLIVAATQTVQILRDSKNWSEIIKPYAENWVWKLAKHKISREPVWKLIQYIAFGW